MQLLSQLGLALLLVLFIGQVSAAKFEFKHSFRSPFYLIRGTTIPFWDFGGSSSVTEDTIRLTPALQSKSGWIWNRRAVEMDSWEVNLGFKVHGGGTLGADGLAFWYVKETSEHGPVYGSKDQWNGLGIFFDTFDNDANGKNPSVLAVNNEGNIKFDIETDGRHTSLASCQFNFRNRETHARITYINGRLSVDMLDASRDGSEYVKCIDDVPVDLPKGYYFGLSADTGGLVDNHDLFFFKTTNLSDEVEDTEDIVNKEPVVDAPKRTTLRDNIDMLNEQGKEVINQKLREKQARMKVDQEAIEQAEREKEEKKNSRIQELLEKLQKIKPEPREHVAHEHSKPEIVQVDVEDQESPMSKQDMVVLLKQVNQILDRQEEVYDIAEEVSQSLDELSDGQEHNAAVFSDTFSEILKSLGECKGLSQTFAKNMYEEIANKISSSTSMSDIHDSISAMQATLNDGGRSRELSNLQNQLTKLTMDVQTIMRGTLDKQSSSSSGWSFWIVVLCVQTMFVVIMLLLFTGRRSSKGARTIPY